MSVPANALEDQTDARSTSTATLPDSRASQPSPETDDSRPVADVIGIFAQEPLWDEVMNEVRAVRKRQNAAEEPSK